MDDPLDRRKKSVSKAEAQVNKSKREEKRKNCDRKKIQSQETESRIKDPRKNAVKTNLDQEFNISANQTLIKNFRQDILKGSRYWNLSNQDSAKH